MTSKKFNILKGLASWFAIGAFASLMGCSTIEAVTAQNPGGAYTPVNAHTQDNQNRLMLKGHDVVSYFTQNKHALGKAEFRSTYEGMPAPSTKPYLTKNPPNTCPNMAATALTVLFTASHGVATQTLG
jgi:hypothetical protein